MPTREWFAPDEPLPRFLSDRADEHKSRVDDHEPRESILLLNAGVLVMTMALISIAISLSWGNPLKVFTDAKAPAVDASSVQPATVQSATTIQATASTRGLPPAATGATARDESPAASDDADRKQADTGAPSGALLGQFEAWAAKQDGPTQDGWARAEAQVEPQVETQVQPVRPLEDAPARGSQDTQAPVRSVQKHRTIRPLQNAQAQMQSVRKPTPTVRRARTTQVEARPAQDVRAPEQPGQSAPPASFTYWRRQ